MKYTNEKNINMLIALMKAYNIKKVISSPGAMNISFIGSIQNDPFFEIYSCVDERSACYMACGLAEESGEIVAISCTGATSSRNYLPGLTEAYYRKLPILAITSAQHLGKIGHNIPQVLDRTVPLNDIVKISVQVPTIESSTDEWACNISINKALLELTHNGKGPVHINLMTSFSKEYNINQLPNVRKINRFNYNDNLPKITKEKVAIFIGAHSKFSDELTNTIDEFCEKYNGVVLCDRTSNYFGKYRILANIICDQESYNFPINNIELLIHIGNISGAYLNLHVRDVWRVNEDGEIRDTFNKLSKVFEMDELTFFKTYNKFKLESVNTTNFNNWKEEFDKLSKKSLECELPLSNLWLAKNMINKLPNKSELYLAILNSLRSWNLFDTENIIYGYSNTGGFGIDGTLSTIIGASLNNPNKNYYGVIGDLAFFYDLNSLGNHNIKNNLRILLVNNGCGTEFHNYSHSAQVFGNEVEKYIAADGHFGNKSKTLVKNFAENLNFEYISASTKEEVTNKIDYFTSPEIYDKSIIFEIFTNSGEESEALKTIRNLQKDIKITVKNNVKSVLNTKTKNVIKKLINMEK